MIKTEEDNKQERSALPEKTVQTEIHLEFSPRVLEILGSLEECFSQHEIKESASQSEPVCN